MPNEKTIRCQDSGLSCRAEDAAFRVISYEGTASRLHIPDQIDGCPVTAVEKKAFWGNRSLQYISLPDTVKEIGDWAFAGCRMLQEIRLPKREMRIGNQIFKDSGRLKRIFAGAAQNGLARLLAAAVTDMGAGYLLDPLQAGSRAWYQSLDARILDILRDQEETALKNLVYCAEEDMLAKQQDCLLEQEKRKARLALLRLAYPEYLQQTVYRTLTEYVCQRTKGCPAEAAWEAVKESREEQFLYCDCLFAAGGINGQNMAAVLNDLDDRYVELKAYILKCRQNGKEQTELWNRLEL